MGLSTGCGSGGRHRHRRSGLGEVQHGVGSSITQLVQSPPAQIADVVAGLVVAPVEGDPGAPTELPSLGSGLDLLGTGEQAAGRDPASMKAK